MTDPDALRVAIADALEQAGHPELARVARKAADELERKADIDLRTNPKTGLVHPFYRVNGKAWMPLPVSIAGSSYFGGHRADLVVTDEERPWYGADDDDDAELCPREGGPHGPND